MSINDKLFWILQENDIENEEIYLPSDTPIGKVNPTRQYSILQKRHARQKQRLLAKQVNELNEYNRKFAEKHKDDLNASPKVACQLIDGIDFLLQQGDFISEVFNTANLTTNEQDLKDVQGQPENYSEASLKRSYNRSFERLDDDHYYEYEKLKEYQKQDLSVIPPSVLKSIKRSFSSSTRNLSSSRDKRRRIYSNDDQDYTSKNKRDLSPRRDKKNKRRYSSDDEDYSSKKSKAVPSKSRTPPPPPPMDRTIIDASHTTFNRKPPAVVASSQNKPPVVASTPNKLSVVASSAPPTIKVASNSSQPHHKNKNRSDEWKRSDKSSFSKDRNHYNDRKHSKHDSTVDKSHSNHMGTNDTRSSKTTHISLRDTASPDSQPNSPLQIEYRLKQSPSDKTPVELVKNHPFTVSSSSSPDRDSLYGTTNSDRNLTPTSASSESPKISRWNVATNSSSLPIVNISPSTNTSNNHNTSEKSSRWNVEANREFLSIGNSTIRQPSSPSQSNNTTAAPIVNSTGKVSQPNAPRKSRWNVSLTTIKTEPSADDTLPSQSSTLPLFENEPPTVIDTSQKVSTNAFNSTVFHDPSLKSSTTTTSLPWKRSTVTTEASSSTNSGFRFQPPKAPMTRRIAAPTFENSPSNMIWSTPPEMAVDANNIHKLLGILPPVSKPDMDVEKVHELLNMDQPRTHNSSPITNSRAIEKIPPKPRSRTYKNNATSRPNAPPMIQSTNQPPTIESSSGNNSLFIQGQTVHKSKVFSLMDNGQIVIRSKPNRVVIKGKDGTSKVYGDPKDYDDAINGIYRGNNPVYKRMMGRTQYLFYKQGSGAVVTIGPVSKIQPLIHQFFLAR